MDATAPLKSEVFRPLVTNIVPGAIALAPYVLIAAHFNPIVVSFWTEHPNAFVALVTVAVVAVGLLLEIAGTSIEVWWDNRLNTGAGDHLKNWDAYLQLELKDEIVGQRYLRSVLTRLKFELSLPPALVLFWVGLIWLHVLDHLWSTPGIVGATLCIGLLVWYILYESYKSASVLAQTRALIIAAMATRQPMKR